MNSQGLIVITGASRGIGAALTAQFAAEGRPVMAVARRFTTAPPAGVVWVEADLATSEGVAQVIDAVRADGRDVDVLVNNAGIQIAMDLAGNGDYGPEAATEIAVNLVAPIRLTQGLLDKMRRSGGVVVNVTSLVSRHPKPSAPVYSATKAGLWSATRSLRYQLQPLGIAVVEAVPPLVETDMTSGRGKGKMSAGEMAEAIRAGIVRGRSVVAPGLAGRVLMLNRLAPWLVARVLARE